MPATGAGRARRFVAAMDDDVADVGHPGESVGKNHDGIFQVEQAVSQQNHGANEAQPPKCLWHHDLFAFFRGIPLHEEAREKNGVAEEPYDFPGIPGDAEEFSVVPDQVGEGVHR